MYIKKYNLFDALKEEWNLFVGVWDNNKINGKIVLERYRRFLKTGRAIHVFFQRYLKKKINVSKIKEIIKKKHENFEKTLFLIKKMNKYERKKLINCVYKI